METNITGMYEQSKKRAIVRRLVYYLAQEQEQTIDFELLCQRIKITQHTDMGIQMIPTQSILGCVANHEHLDADFNPKNDSVRPQWEEIVTRVKNAEYIPPIKVYQIGSHYFVEDGHICVSVFRYLSMPVIDAAVIRLETSDVIRDTAELQGIIT